MARYWVGGDTNTDWSNPNNWSTSSGGAGGAGIPTRTQNVYFDAKGSGNCNLTANVECSGLYFTSGITYDLIDNGYQMDIYSNIDAYSTTQVLQCTGTAVQKQSVNSGTMRTYPLSNRFYKYVLESGVSITCNYYFHTTIFQAYADTTINAPGSLYFCCMYPTVDHFFDAHPTFKCSSGMRWYLLSVSLSNSGCVQGQMGSIVIGYGGGGGATLTMLSDHFVDGYFHIHASHGSVTEAEARKVDMNGYNLECDSLILGLGTSTYYGYDGMIKFGTGSHKIGHIQHSNYGSHGNAYIDWGSGVVHFTSYINLAGVQNNYTHDGSTKVIMIPGGTHTIESSGRWLPTLWLQTDTQLLEYDLNVHDLRITPPSQLDTNGYNLNMPQRIRPLTLGSDKTIIGKRWING